MLCFSFTHFTIFFLWIVEPMKGPPKEYHIIPEFIKWIDSNVNQLENGFSRELSGYPEFQISLNMIHTGMV